MNTRTFTPEDQLAFAKLSGDFNPLHIDALAARRLMFGSTVVHGVHALLWALDCCFSDSCLLSPVAEGREAFFELQSVKAFFAKPIKVGDEVHLSQKDKGDGRFSINLSINGVTMTKIDVALRLNEALRQDEQLRQDEPRRFDYVKTDVPPKIEPLNLSEEDIEQDSGSLDLFLNEALATQLLPNVVKYLSPVQVAVILSSTRLVGVMCPGLRSLYSEIELKATEPNEKTSLNYEVSKLDKRFGLAHLKLEAPDMVGTIKAFHRPEALEQPGYLSIKEQVDNQEFADQRALIIGGSRGLGEVAAKILCAGGADVKVTYHQGKDDALQIVKDIASNGGIVDSLQFDVLNPELDEDLMADWQPTHLYYFATPFIFSGVNGVFSRDLFEKFCNYYVLGFINSVNALKSTGLKRIFYPSTVAIDELPSSMGEYVVSKAASEMLCEFIEKNHKGTIIHKPRFPRVATDQTTSMMPVDNQDPVPLMIDHLRTFRELSKS